ncbi:MAG: formylglycine-generating enzyme family protein, partial [Planctomycetaceae bacterium]
LLQKIPAERRSLEVTDALQSVEKLLSLQTNAVKSLKSAMQTGRYMRGVKETIEYRKALKDHSLSDSRFNAAVEKCRLKAEGKRQRQWSSIRKAAAAASVLTVFVFALSHFWKQYQAVDEAIRHERWDDVLRLDDGNVTALIGRANFRLRQPTPDIDGAFQDLRAAEQIDPFTTGLREVKGLATAKRSVVRSNTNVIVDAREDLENAEFLGTDESELLAARKALIAALIRKANLGSRADQLVEAESCLKEASRLGAAESLMRSGTKVLATAWFHRGEDSVGNGDLEAVAAACSNVDRLQVAGVSALPLRVEVARIRGRDMERIGNWSEALAAYEEVEKLTPDQPLLSERAVLHVKLGQIRVKQGDIAVASEHLLAAVELDDHIDGIKELSLAVADLSVAGFEMSPTDANCEKALTAISSVEKHLPILPALADLKLRVANTLLKRAGDSVRQGDLGSATSNYRTAASLSENASLRNSTKTVLIAALQTRRLNGLMRQDAKSAVDAQKLLADLDPDAARVLPPGIVELPGVMLAKLPNEILIQLPSSALSKVPELPTRVVPLLLKRAGTQLSGGNVGSAVADFEQAVEYGADMGVAAPLKSQLVSAVVTRFQRAVASESYDQAFSDYGLIVRLDSSTLNGVTGEWSKVPPAELIKMPSALLATLPPVRNSIGMEFKRLSPGTFTMGDDSGDADEQPAHQVTLTETIALGVYEVTQEQYEKVVGSNPSAFTGPQNPVEQLRWEEAVEFCRKLSALPAEKSAGYVYRLPTEAEWEYACRAGTTTKYSFGDSESELGDYAWYDKNSGVTTHPVGGKQPNAWGLYDMHGNVWEWCQDWYGNYPSGWVTDPTGPSSSSNRVRRGGSCSSGSGLCRSAGRSRDAPGLRGSFSGFRVLRSSVK